MYTYLLLPILSWLIAGTTKFLINYLRYGNKAIKLIGDGGFPSTHTTVITSLTSFIGLSEGLNSPIFGLSFTILILVIFDAIGIRKRVGKHAEIINAKLLDNKTLREKSGHSWIEIVGGLIIGFNIGMGLFVIST